MRISDWSSDVCSSDLTLSLHVECAGTRHVFPLYSPQVPPAVAPMPARVAVLSDLEGNIAFLEQALRRLGVVDADGKWAYGGGHLVVLGDSVDRGRDVFAVLWRDRKSTRLNSSH